MTWSAYNAPAVHLALEALARGPLVKTRKGKWLFRGRRMFNAETVNKLIADGSAERIGNTVTLRSIP